MHEHTPFTKIITLVRVHAHTCIPISLSKKGKAVQSESLFYLGVAFKALTYFSVINSDTYPKVLVTAKASMVASATVPSRENSELQLQLPVPVRGVSGALKGHGPFSTALPTITCTVSGKPPTALRSCVVNDHNFPSTGSER